MNKRLPYEEELLRQLNDLPLPDENVSWADMNRRLDEDNDDGIIVPPPQRGCLGYSLLLIFLAAIVWLIVRPDKWFRDRNQKDILPSGEIHSDGRKDTVINDKITSTSKNFKGPESLVKTKNRFDSVADNNNEHLAQMDLLKSTGKKDSQQRIARQKIVPTNKYAKTSNLPIHKPLPEKNRESYLKRNNNIQKKNKKIPGSLKSEISSKRQFDSLTNTEKNVTEDDKSVTKNVAINIDSAIKKTADSNIVKKKTTGITPPAKIVKQDSNSKRPVYFAAGIALHQILPVSGQKLVPYNSLGRKSTLADYIPSLYFRMYKDKKWFLQTEFRYGAPQYTKEILYGQKKVVDTFTSTTLATSNRLKKTFYHQVPVSFNYYVLPHFSAGIGFVWNKFSSAVSEQEVLLTNNITLTDSIQAKTILHSKKADSNFVKSYFQALIETQYQWKRLSFGARYSFGLQPYIRFRLPGGEQREEKNSSLQIFLRYDLWESKKMKGK